MAVDIMARGLALSQSGGSVPDGSITEQKLSDNVKEILQKTPHQIFMDKFLPNIYPDANNLFIGDIPRTVDRTCQQLVAIGCKQVSLLLSITAYTEPLFSLKPTINYPNVISTIHSYGLAIKMVRFSNSAYGDNNMKDNTKLANLGTSCVSILSSLGLSGEVEKVMVLNETEVITTNSAYNIGVASCINTIKSAGYKVGVTDGAKVFASHTPENIALYDYAGFNDYVPLACFEDNQNLQTALSAWESEDLSGTMGYFQSLGIKTFVSEYGCTLYEGTLAHPESSTPTGDYDQNGMKYVELMQSSFKQYCFNSGLIDTSEYFCPWFVDMWTATNNLKHIFGGV